MKTKRTSIKKIIPLVAFLVILAILGSGLLSIVNAATATMTTNGSNSLNIKDSNNQTVDISDPTNVKTLKDNTTDKINGVTYEKVGISNLSNKLSAKYAFSFKIDENTKIESWKEGIDSTIEYKKNNQDTTFLPTNESQNGNFGVKISNAGMYLDPNGKIHIINLKLTFSWEAWKVNENQQYPYINIRTYSKGSDQYGLFFSFLNMSYSTKIELFDDDNFANKVNINMNMLLSDIDGNQFYGLGNFSDKDGNKGLTHIHKIRYTSGSNVCIEDNPNNNYSNYVWFFDNDGHAGDNIIEDTVRIELDTVNSFDFVVGSPLDPCSYHYGKRKYYPAERYINPKNFTTGFNSWYDADFYTTLRSKINEYNSSNTATYPGDIIAQTGVAYLKNEPYASYDLSTPIERINDYVNEYYNVESEIGKSQIYAYKVYHYVPNVFEEQYLSNYKFTTKVPLADKYNYTKIYKFKGYNADKTENLEEITSSFNINYNEGTRDITATANANILNKKDFYDNIYVMVVNVTEDSIPTNNNGSELGADNITKTYTLDHNSKVEATSSNSSITLTNQNTNTVHTRYKEIRIPIKKVWNDNSNAAKLRPEKITYSITAVTSDGTPVHTFDSGEITTDTNNTKEVYSGFVPLKNENEQYMIYQISEGNIPNYAGKVEYTKNGEQITKVTITNTLSASFKITTRVDGTGGTISGSGQNPYETVEAGKNSTKDITITPNSGYQIKSITINGKTQQLPTNVKNPYTLNKFTNMYEDKKVVVKFEPIPKPTGIVNHYLKGSNPLQKLTESTNLTNLEIGESLAAEKYKANIKHYTYDSAIPSSITVNEESSKNVLNLYYTLTPYEYSVRYYYDGVEDESAIEKGTAEFGKQITTYEDKSKEIYKLQKTENVPLTISDNPSNNVMKIYYVMNENEKEYDYSIEYYYDNKKDETATVTGKAKYESIINNYTDKKKDGYVFKNVENKPLTITNDSSKNIMKVYYVSDAKITTKYIDKETGKEISTPNIEDTKIGKTYTTEKKDIKNYSYVSDTGNTSGTVNEPEIEVIYYYEPLREIIIKYVDKQTGKEIADSSTNNGKTGDKFDITSKKQEINGYTLVEEPTEKEATYEKDSQTFTYYYSKNSKIIVRYVDEDTGEQIEKEIEKSGTVGQKFDISDTEKNIANYYLVKRPDSLTGKYTENEQIFTFYYRKDPGLANKPIPKTGMNEIIRNTSIIALLIVLSNGLRLFVRYKKEEKRSIR